MRLETAIQQGNQFYTYKTMNYGQLIIDRIIKDLKIKNESFILICNLPVKLKANTFKKE